MKYFISFFSTLLFSAFLFAAPAFAASDAYGLNATAKLTPAVLNG